MVDKYKYTVYECVTNDMWSIEWTSEKKKKKHQKSLPQNDTNESDLPSSVSVRVSVTLRRSLRI